MQIFSKPNETNKNMITHNFCRILSFGNEFVAISMIKFRLKSKCRKLGKSCSAAKLISRISLFANSSVSNAIKPWKIGILSSLLSLSFKSMRFGKLRMPSSHNAASKLFCGSSLYERERKKHQNEIIEEIKHKNIVCCIRYVIF